MAIRYNRERRAIFGLLGAGTLVPALLLLAVSALVGASLPMRAASAVHHVEFNDD